jgi:hypothetical protein
VLLVLLLRCWCWWGARPTTLMLWLDLCRDSDDDTAGAARPATLPTLRRCRTTASQGRTNHCHTQRSLQTPTYARTECLSNM